MKKLKAFAFFAAAMAVMVFICGCESKVSTTSSNQPAPLKVGLVLDAAGRGDGSFNDAACKGLEQAKNELGSVIETKLIESSDNNELEDNLRTLTKEQVQLVIGMGYFFTDPVINVAKEFPQTRFVLIDANVPGLQSESNVTCVTFKDNEGAFLAGVAAALQSRTGKIGFIGGAQIPVMEKFEAGYTAGARFINPGVAVSCDYIGTGVEGFSDPNKGKMLALKQMDNDVDVIFQAAGASGKGIIEAVAAREKLVIGSDVDQTYMVPEDQRPYVLTSIIKGVDGSVCDVIKRQLNKKLNGGYIELGIKDGVQVYAENDINKNILADIKPRLENIKSKISSQEIQVPATIKELPIIMDDSLF